MRALFALAALGIFIAAIAPSTPARAEEWCGFQDKAGSKVRCGYSSLTECQQAVGGKDAVCLPDPYFAERKRSARAS